MDSYVCGVGEEPLRYETIGTALTLTAQRYADHEALVVRHQGVRLSWAELDRQVEAHAAALLALGLEPSDRIGIWSTNCTEWVITQLAAARAGLVLVTVNPAYRLAELEHALSRTRCKALVFGAGLRDAVYADMLMQLMPELGTAKRGELHSARLPSLRLLISLVDDGLEAAVPFRTLAEHADAAALARLDAVRGSLQPDDPINVQFTSGTTGLPKGATLSHCNILNNGCFVARGMRLQAQDRLCIPVPLYHCFGMVMGVLGCLTHGATMVFPCETFDPQAVLEAVEQERCTALYGVPTMFIAELGHPDIARYDLSSLRTGIMAGAPCPIEVMRRVFSQMHMEQVTIAYGMTETSPVSFQSAVDDPIEKRVSTVGRIHPHVQVKIIDEEGRVVPRGVTGELCTRGYSVMLGYWDEPERTAEAIDAAGWMHTGDLATLDEEGYCRIVGRLKDMIIRGGENIYPREIEEYLFRHPKVADVAVFGVPDAHYGEQVAAWIRLKEGMSCDQDEIRTFCGGQMAYFKVPRYIRFVDEFPMTVTGKVQKYVMREQFSRELSGEGASA